MEGLIKKSKQTVLEAPGTEFILSSGGELEDQLVTFECDGKAFTVKRPMAVAIFEALGDHLGDRRF